MEPIRQIIRESVELVWKIYLNEDFEPSQPPEYVYYGLGAMQTFYTKKEGMIKRGQGKRAINFVEDLQVAKYFAFIKNYRKKGIVLRTKFAYDKFEPSQRYPQSWRMRIDFPINEIEVLDANNNWIPLEKFNPFSKIS